MFLIRFYQFFSCLQNNTNDRNYLLRLTGSVVDDGRKISDIEIFYFCAKLSSAWRRIQDEFCYFYYLLGQIFSGLRFSVCMLIQRRWVALAVPLAGYGPWIFSLFSVPFNKSNRHETQRENQYLMASQKVLFCWKARRQPAWIRDGKMLGICRKQLCFVLCRLLKGSVRSMRKIKISITKFFFTGFKICVALSFYWYLIIPQTYKYINL